MQYCTEHVNLQNIEKAKRRQKNVFQVNIHMCFVVTVSDGYSCSCLCVRACVHVCIILVISFHFVCVCVTIVNRHIIMNLLLYLFALFGFVLFGKKSGGW